MGLRDILDEYKLGTEETSERIDLLLNALRRKPGYSDALKTYGKQRGGADSGDFVGPQLSSFVSAVQENPDIFRTMLASLFSAAFILDSAEKLPGVGSILGASMDVMLMGGKVLTKSIQAGIPPLMGLLPIPYASMAGLVMAAVFGMIAWPMIALVSLSRQDFAAAMDAYARAIPPPFGDMLANTFTEGNRAIAKVNEKRERLTADLSNAFTMLSGALASASVEAREGLKTLATEISAAAAPKPPPTLYQRLKSRVMPAPKPPTLYQRLQARTAPAMNRLQSQLAPTGGFHGRTRRRAWRTPRTRRRSARR
uniref:Uncharacterized protein n=1 Tax=viral metagenome TaxID=1070528 RepID=A0A6C0F403_9ZZZZ